MTVKETVEKPSVGEPVILPVGLSFKPSGNTGSIDTIEISSEHVGIIETVKPTPVCILVDAYEHVSCASIYSKSKINNNTNINKK